ncbi:hypothetical protein AO703_16155 [[Enterobacter] lignolyticus]|uniref:Phage lysis regulatory protein, LysB family n=1 Tax=[Enterobacter] lignolyticus TaxID=1334193 RepID=A0A806X7D0_9ENTR|nr:hypothetical protein AO703_16155 [[Enterobacter] lignolyticus]
MRVLAILLLIVTSVLLFVGHENRVLRQSFDKANLVAHEQKATITTLTAQRAVLAKQNRQNDALQQAWRQKLSDIEERAFRQEQTISRLLNENAEFRSWYVSALPDAVRRVHQRAACASANHCEPALSAGQPVPNARQLPRD